MILCSCSSYIRRGFVLEASGPEMFRLVFMFNNLSRVTPRVLLRGATGRTRTRTRASVQRQPRVFFSPSITMGEAFTTDTPPTEEAPFPLTELDRWILQQTDEEFKKHSWDELKKVIGKYSSIEGASHSSHDARLTRHRGK